MKSVIAWFANNAVAANLSMAFIMVAGLLVLPLIERETIPDISFDIVEIVVGLPGAGPTQVERSISSVIEQSLVGIDGILDINTVAQKNISVTTLEISNTVSLNEAMNKIRGRVDAVPLPAEASRPIVREITFIEPVLALALTGNTDLQGLNAIAESLAAQIRALPGVSLAYVISAPRREFLVELSENEMQRYGVSFAEITRVIRSVAADVTGATLKTEEGDVSIVSESVINNSASLEALAIRSHADGARITLSDLAQIKNNYLVDDGGRKFDGKNVVYIGINRAQSEDLIILANNVAGFVDLVQSTLPSGVSLEISNDISKEVSGRINMLTNNAISGFILVFAILLLFMNLRLSFWTSLGIPISFLGAFFVLFYLSESLNMVSLFAFILVLGIVVDDAIIVGESIYSQHEKNNFGVQASIQGTVEVYSPVIFAALTTMIAFSPMLFMPGEEGRLVFIVPVVVISVLAFSLVESLLILPSHLAGVKAQKNELFPFINNLQRSFSNFLDGFINKRYSPALEKALIWRYSTLVFFIMMFFISISLMAFRWVSVEVVSNIESDILIAHLEMIADTPAQETELALSRLEKAAFTVRDEVNEDVGFKQITHVATELDLNQSTKARVSIYLNSEVERDISGAELEAKILKEFGQVDNVRSVQIATSAINTGTQIDIELAHTNIETLKSASQALQQILKNYEGVRGSWDSLAQGGREVGFSLKPEASDMGVSSAQIAGQIRQAFHGDSVQIFDEHGLRVPVNIQYPEEKRSSLWFLESLPISLADGSYVPIYSVADLNYGEAPAVINLHNGQRSLRVFASLAEGTSEAQVMASLTRDFLNDLSDAYPSMTWKRAGGQQRSHEILDYLALAYPLSLLAMYLLMATLFASYTQPLMIMTAIPFGIVGALFGHLLLGISVTLWSLIGIIAVSGVVVNDNLVLIDRINKSLSEGVSVLTAIREAGVVRFRPIALTSLTTFLGLAPLMFDGSAQAQFLVPMAVSLGFGVMFATVISLILVPVLYAILYDLQMLVEKQSIPQRINSLLRSAFRSDQA